MDLPVYGEYSQFILDWSGLRIFNMLRINIVNYIDGYFTKTNHGPILLIRLRIKEVRFSASADLLRASNKVNVTVI